MLKFSPANVKLQSLKSDKPGKVYSFDMLAGVTCPFAMLCHSQVVVGLDGKRKIQDGAATEFRCYAASLEALYKNVYNLHKHNTDIIDGLKTHTEILDELCKALPVNVGVIRIHTSGDFNSQVYFDAWIAMAMAHPDILFYAYTKALPFWVARLRMIPENLILTASRGGTHDDLIDSHGLRSVKVVYHPNEAERLGLEIDHDDSHAADPHKKDKDFALLIHGTQPIGSKAAAAKKVLKSEGIKFAYSAKK